MNKKIIAISLLGSGLLGASGFGLYHLGMHQAQSGPMRTESAKPKPMPMMAKVDPSVWGIPEGEAATRRHIETGLKAGDVDPIAGRKILYYHDPMVPGKKFDAPAKSPFMDMMLVPAYAGSAGADSGTVTVSSRIQQNLGLRTGEVVEGQIAPQIAAVGTIVWNERGQFTVQARATGFIEKLYVRAALDYVRKGQALFDLYVPDWVAVQEDYLTLRRMQGSNLETLVDASKQRMKQVGMSEAQIALVVRTGQLQPRITLFAPASGVLTELMAREGGTVMQGMLLARVNEVNTVWAQAEIPESQTGSLSIGSAVSAVSPALPGQVFKGSLQALLPEVSSSTRTRKARMELANPKGQLVPGMFVQMQLSGHQTRRSLLVPSEALIRTGKRTLVMAVEGSAFRPVQVQTGFEQGGQTEIISGLFKGQKIVLSGQFLIDSEASLKGVEARVEAGAKQESNVAPSNIYHTSARVEAMTGDTLTLTHPAIPDLNWPSMTMDFILAPSITQPELVAGTQIDIAFRTQEGSAPLIIKLEPRGNKPAEGAQ